MNLATVPVSYSAITPAEVAVSSNNPLSPGPTLTMCRYKEAMEDRDFKFHLRHLEALRARVGLTADQPEPKYSSLERIKGRIADLTHIMACVLKYNRFYDQLLDDRHATGLNGIHPASASNITVVPVVNSLQLVTEAVIDSSDQQPFETFEDYVNQHKWLVPEAPRPIVDASDIDSSSYWITDLTSIHEPDSLGQHEQVAAETVEGIVNSQDGDDSFSAAPSVRSAATSFTDLLYHPVVSDVFIPTTTRAGRTTKVTKKFLQTAVTANQQSNATSSLRPAGGHNALSSPLLVLRF